MSSASPVVKGNHTFFGLFICLSFWLGYQSIDKGRFVPYSHSFSEITRILALVGVFEEKITKYIQVILTWSLWAMLPTTFNVVLEMKP